MKNYLFNIGIILILFSCSHEETIEESVLHHTELLSKKEINSIIKKSLRETGNFNWSDQNIKTLFSALRHGNNILTVGYHSNQSRSKNPSSKKIKDGLLNLIRSKEKISSKAINNFYSNDNLNLIDVKVKNEETVEALLNDNRVRYIEPADYCFFENNLANPRNTSHSHGFMEDERYINRNNNYNIFKNVPDPISEKAYYRRKNSNHLKRIIESHEESLYLNSSKSSSQQVCCSERMKISTNDYRTIVPGARVPWAFDLHKIPEAWDYSTGSGVTIALIDTGISSEQTLMNQNFNDGHSKGRSLQKFGTFVDSSSMLSNYYDGVNDKCGHGTHMASVATAPRNDNNLPVGVAYNANLVSYRAVRDVIINEYNEKKGVSEALIALGNRSDVKIISMSIGSPFSIQRVEDAIKYAYSKGKMIIAAGGTSTPFTTWFGVVFPASMRETVAVTGVKEGVYESCDECHAGEEIDFTIQMQRTNGTKNTIPVLNYYDGASHYEGGASIATATTAGIAALIWSKNPDWSREQVLERMKQSSHYYPSKDPQFGYGNINALKAVQ
ncbi:S8 family peptidase [Tenacibaculum sp. C7A-26P2]|uniref:S8 family peptidase n=1 Tax=Tenacibaculum sp. C7A-26P2 TaxID=3447504 RepID=UPI003F843158